MFKRYITDSLEQQIIALLDEWATGQLGTGLSWANLEKAFGYSRQALSGNPAIKEKFDEAKQALRDRKRMLSKRVSDKEEVEVLRKENTLLKKRVDEYEKRFTRWMHNCHVKGINPLDLDNPMGVSFKTAMRYREGKGA
mgnify:CR=1 FL=1